ncbi:MAG: hypothetical protein KAI73_05150 [Rhodospirillaceae bacterium]|nr:hypothetical protein [Rhodospirillaceae bacterium]
MNNEMEHEDGKDAEVDAKCLLQLAIDLRGEELSEDALRHIRAAHLLLEKYSLKQEKET